MPSYQDLRGMNLHTQLSTALKPYVCRHFMPSLGRPTSCPPTFAKVVFRRPFWLPVRGLSILRPSTPGFIATFDKTTFQQPYIFFFSAKNDQNRKLVKNEHPKFTILGCI